MSTRPLNSATEFKEVCYFLEVSNLHVSAQADKLKAASHSNNCVGCVIRECKQKKHLTRFFPLLRVEISNLVHESLECILPITIWAPRLERNELS